MRQTIFVFAFALLLTACKQKDSSSTVSSALNDLGIENLKGKITQVETDSYIIDSTGKTGPLDEKNIEKFDSSGYTISSVYMNGKDSIKSQNTFEHNATGYVTGMQTNGANNEKKSAMTIDVDSAGKYSFAKSFDSTGKMDVYYNDITSNKFGQVTGAKGYHIDSTLKMSFTNDYDSSHYVGGTTKDSVGKVTYASKVKLNDKKDMAQLDETITTKDPKTKRDSTKNITTTYTYEGWDSHGNWTQQTIFNEKGKPTKLVKRVIIYKE